MLITNEQNKKLQIILDEIIMWLQEKMPNIKDKIYIKLDTEEFLVIDNIDSYVTYNSNFDYQYYLTSFRKNNEYPTTLKQRTGSKKNGNSNEILKLMRNWKNIKNNILKSIIEQEQILKSIDTFEI
jgi:hypothetical protein